MKKYCIKEAFVGTKFMGNVGVYILDNNISQKDLKKIYMAGHTNVVEVIEVAKKKDEPKED